MTGATRSTRKKSTSSAGRRGTGSATPCERPSSGIVSTNPGGARSSPASFARTTSDSTAAADCGCARLNWRSFMKRVLTLVLAALLVVPSLAPGAPTSAPDRRLNLEEISAFPSFVRRVEPAIVGLRVRNAENAASSARLGSRRFGSAVIFDARGYALTVSYLLLDSIELEARGRDGR